MENSEQKLNFNPQDWDNKAIELKKTFYKVFSPRLFNFPFSFDIDVNRAVTGARKKGYSIPENPMILDTGGKFWGSVLVEVEKVNPADKNVVSFAHNEVYTKIPKTSRRKQNLDVVYLEGKTGQGAREIYMWHPTYPQNKSTKILMVVF